MTFPVRDDLTMDADSFRAIADLAYRESGLALVQHKASMVRSRLRPRLRELGLQDFASYCALISSEKGSQERRYFISALTTNVTHFFREAYHFDILADQLREKLPALRAGARFRIWSAGCSSGQEALSAAITVHEAVPRSAQLNIRILATDIDPQMIIAAREGIYTERAMRGLSEELTEKYFSQLPQTGDEKRFLVAKELRNIISYNELNLLSPWPMQCCFDTVFCRNVVIYFDTRTQQALWPRFHRVLNTGGLLFLGHSERIAEPSREGFDCTGQTTYRAVNTPQQHPAQSPTNGATNRN